MPLSLLSWYRLWFPITGLEILYLPNFALKSPNGIFTWYLGRWSKICSILSYKLSFESLLSSKLGAWTFKIIILHQQPLRTVYDILSLSFNCRYRSGVYKKILFPTDNFCFLFHKLSKPSSGYIRHTETDSSLFPLYHLLLLAKTWSTLISLIKHNYIKCNPLSLPW
jgi:hypothetical protein